MAFNDLINRQTSQKVNAMNVSSLLHELIADSCPTIHKVRLQSLITAVDAATRYQKVTLTGLGRTLPSLAKTKHTIKRMDRLLGNSHLHQERTDIYEVMARHILQTRNEPVILIDWSQVNEEAGFHILRASLALHGRAMTVYEEIHPKHLSHNRAVHGRFLKQLQVLLPCDCQPIVVTDAGFKNPWFKQVEALGWHWLGRIRHFTQYRFIDSPLWHPCRESYDLASTRPGYLGEICLSKHNPLDCHAYLYRKELEGRKKRTQGKRVSKRSNSSAYGRREREPWFLVTNLPPDKLNARQAVAIYQTRMQIEESFRDNKNQRIGLSLKETKSRSVERLQILLLIVTLATYALWLIGRWANQNGLYKHYQANTTRERAVLSYFNLGLQVLRKEPERLCRAELVHLMATTMLSLFEWRSR